MATLIIPGRYLDDVRSAFYRSIAYNSDNLRIEAEGDGDGYRINRPTNSDDRALAVRILHDDLDLYRQIADVEGDAPLAGDEGDLTYVLEELVRVLSNRLRQLKGFTPIDMGAVLDLTAEMQWAAGEAIRLQPGLDERKAA